MVKNYENLARDLLNRLVGRFNTYSELVALNYYKKHEGGTIQWNRGHEDAYEDEARELAEQMVIKINYEMMKSKYFEGETEEFEIEYRAMYLTY